MTTRYRIAVAIAVVLTLSSCADAEFSGRLQAPPVVEVRNVEAHEQPWDTGVYRTDPLELENIEPEYGQVLETLRYGDHIALPFEVDRAFSDGTGSDAAISPSKVAGWANEQGKALVRSYESDFLGGYTVSATDGGTHAVRHTLIRFSSPEVAARVAEEWTVADAKDDDRGVRSRMIVHDDFVVRGVAVNLSNAEEDPYSDWQKTYLDKYFAKQLPMLGSIETRSNTAVPGAVQLGIDPDPGGILRYSVRVEEKGTGIIVGTAGPRAVASNYPNPEEVLAMFEKAGVDWVALNRLTVFRTRNAEAAKQLVEDFRFMDLENGYKLYEEPQGLPGSTCITRDETWGVNYDCSLVYGRYVAAGAAQHFRSQPDTMDAKLVLSQRMAAQYEVFQQMP